MFLENISVLKFLGKTTRVTEVLVREEKRGVVSNRC